MNEQPGDLLDEAGRLFETLRRRWSEPGDRPGRGAGADDRADDDRADDEGAGDVWSRAVAEQGRPSERDRASGERDRQPRIATGAPECRDCPICRAIAVARESGTDVRAHVREAGRSLLAALRDVAAAYERSGGRPPPGQSRSQATGRGPGGAGDDGPTDDG